VWDSSCSYVEYYTGIDPAILFPAIFMMATLIITFIIISIILGRALAYLPATV
jgi:hypothetical protein